MSPIVLSRGSRAQVMHGTALKTNGGLTKKQLKVKNGRIVSTKKSNTKKNPWMQSLDQARKELNMGKKFVLINKGSEGIKLYKKG